MGAKDGSDEAQHTRRGAGARLPVSDPVVFQRGERRIEGWALNLSEGGLRAILDEEVERDEVFEVSVGDDEPRAARVVWARSEGGGAIVGVSFDDAPGAAPPDDP